MELWNFAFSKYWRLWCPIAFFPVLGLIFYGVYSDSLFWMFFPILCVMGIGLFEDAVKTIAYKYYTRDIK